MTSNGATNATVFERRKNPQDNGVTDFDQLRLLGADSTNTFSIQMPETAMIFSRRNEARNITGVFTRALMSYYDGT